MLLSNLFNKVEIISYERFAFLVEPRDIEMYSPFIIPSSLGVLQSQRNNHVISWLSDFLLLFSA